MENLDNFKKVRKRLIIGLINIKNAIVFIADQKVNSGSYIHECKEADNNRLVWLLYLAWSDP